MEGKIPKIVIQKVASKLEGIRKNALELLTIYEEYEELNNQISISKVIPMSLDDWVISLKVKIEELEAMEG